MNAPVNKILLALQFWEGDKAQAMRVARVIADLEPYFCTKADFLFMARFDCSQDLETIKEVSKKFQVLHRVNRRRGEMWPHGCNELWFGVMDYVYSYSHPEAKKIPSYKAILTFESDSCPLIPHWIERLSESWDRANVKVHGPMQIYPRQHINGNSLFSGDMKFLHWISREVGGCAPSGGWDYILAPEFSRRGWSDCPLMKSWWQCPTLPEETYQDLIQKGVVFLHGVKDNSVVNLVRKRFLRS